MAAQWEEEGWVDPSSFAELPDEQEALAKVYADANGLTNHPATVLQLACKQYHKILSDMLTAGLTTALVYFREPVLVSV